VTSKGNGLFIEHNAIALGQSQASKGPSKVVIIESRSTVENPKTLDTGSTSSAFNIISGFVSFSRFL
jgi:hypothetical protein